MNPQWNSVIKEHLNPSSNEHLNPIKEPTFSNIVKFYKAILPGLTL